MSFWLSYVGIGFAGHGRSRTSTTRARCCSRRRSWWPRLLLPAVALGGFVWTRRWRYGPFFLGLALVAVLIMGAGFPDGTPLRHGLYFAYNHFSVRCSSCARPTRRRRCWRWRSRALAGRPRRALGWLGARGAPCLVAGRGARWPARRPRARGLAARRAGAPRTRRCRSGRCRRRGATRPPTSIASCPPTPARWCCRATCSRSTRGAARSTRSCPRSPRARSPSAPRCPTRICARPTCCGRSTGSSTSSACCPASCEPLLSLIGVRSVVTGTDDDLARSDAPPPADAAATLSAQPGFARRPLVYGPVARFAPTGLGPTAALPEVRRYDLPSARGLVRVEPRAAPDRRRRIGSGDRRAGGVRRAAGPARAALCGGSRRPRAARRARATAATS